MTLSLAYMNLLKPLASKSLKLKAQPPPAAVCMATFALHTRLLLPRSKGIQPLTSPTVLAGQSVVICCAPPINKLISDQVLVLRRSWRKDLVSMRPSFDFKAFVHSTVRYTFCLLRKVPFGIKLGCVEDVESLDTLWQQVMSLVAHRCSNGGDTK